MDIEKIRKWLEITNQYRESDFWSSVLKQKTPDDFLKKGDSCRPIYDLYQNEYFNFMIIETPGVAKEEILLQLVTNTKLLIKYSIKPFFLAETEVKKERVYGEFERIIELEEATESHLLSVKHVNGLLLISYPRKTADFAFYQEEDVL